MIEILDKARCCGCNACVQRCPRQCITMHEDGEGFLYPWVDKELCIDCRLCERVCPVLHSNEPRKPLAVYGASNKDEGIRRQSSSGGVFTALAEEVIKEGGVVFGARFDENWEVKHDYVETVEELVAFRGSKYVQSRLENNYQKAEVFLKAGRRVLFSGTPCQIAGLKRFLNKEYENLLAVDFICHGVPSPKVWRMYLKEIVARQCEKNSVSFDPKSPFSGRDVRVEGISFRDKRLGWKKFSFALTLSMTYGSGEKNTVSLCEVFTKNAFVRGFLNNLYLRPSCYECPAKGQRSHADITLADFWCIYRYHPELSDYFKGVSLVMTNEKGKAFIGKYCQNIDVIPSTYDIALKVNPAIARSASCHPKRTLFFERYDKAEELSKYIHDLQRVPLAKCIMKFASRVYGRIKFELGRL